MNKGSSIIFFVFILVSSLFPLKGVAMGDKTDYKTQIKEKLKQVDISDGVSKEEAIIIAQNHMIDEGIEKTCDLRSAEVFAEDDPYWDKNTWHISFKTTFKERLRSGSKWITVNVDKKTGKVEISGWGPS